MRRLLLLLLGLVVLAGCDSDIPDPNDPSEVGMMQPEVLMRNLKWASEAANERVNKGEITREEAKERISKYADELLTSVKIGEITDDKAWEYAEVFRTAKRWAEAEKILRQALEKPRDEDRRVNDSLRLAHVLAEQGKVEEAIKTARSVFDADAKDTAPILLAVYLEIAPAARGKGHDEELAKLVEDAIEIHTKTIVDPKTTAGQDFITTRSHHMSRAAQIAADLYRRAGKHDLADKVFQRVRELGSGGIRV